MKIGFFTLGCKVNQYETQVMRELFEKQGDTVITDAALCDVFIINSCTVTAESDRKTRQMLRKYRAICKNAVIVLAGCMPQAFPDIADKLPEADIIVGNTDPKEIPLLVKAFLENGEKIVKIEKHERSEIFNTPDITDFEERTRAFMKIEDGCDRYCTYCIIPFARGAIRSKNLESIKEEAKILGQKGFCEIVLVGINLTSYGKGTDINICDAIDAVCSVDESKRVRLGSLEPDHISDEMLKRLKAQKKFCPQFHLSLQSGCDETLKRMNRHYDTAFYRDLVKRIRENFDNAAITTDIMVGFAGESEEEFTKSLDFAKEIGFASAHVFAYSRREGTVAYNMKNQVDKNEKSRRSRLMIEATLKTQNDFLDGMIGKTCSVLFETKDDLGFYHGFSENYCQVKAKSDITVTGKILNIRITGRENNCLIGEIQ